MTLTEADEILGFLERGQTAIDFAAAVREVVAALHEQGNGSGKVTLTIAFAGKDGFVALTPSVTAVRPTRKRRTSNLWSTENGELHTEDPAQVRMSFVEARRSAVDVR